MKHLIFQSFALTSLFASAPLSAVDHWKPIPDVMINGMETPITPPSIPAGIARGRQFAFGLALHDRCLADTAVFNELDIGPIDTDTIWQQIESDYTAEGSHYGKGWRWTDCSVPVPAQIFSEYVKIERTHEIKGDANNWRFSNGFARTYLRSYFNVICDTDPIGNQDSEAIYRHEGEEGSAAPTAVELNISWPPGLTIVWDTAGSDAWADSWTDDPSTAIIEEGQISEIDRRISNNGHAYVFVDVTMNARSQSSVKNFGLLARSNVKMVIKEFRLTK